MKDTNTLLASLVEKMEGKRPSAIEIGDAPGDNAVGSEHRAFGRNIAIDQCITIIKEAMK
jgi:hypothetical protein